MITYIGAENIISPLGENAGDNFDQIKKGNSGVSLHKEIGINKEDLYLSKLASPIKFYELLALCLKDVIKGCTEDIISSKDTLVIVSTTKANIDEDISTPIINDINKLKKEFNLQNNPLVISNACVSGVMAMNTANNYIKSDIYKHVFVIGADVISDFVLFGFQSLYAVSNEPCQPFDKNRKGISLGEGAGGVLMTNNPTLFIDQCFEFTEGTSSNDANHISGPSRTGEGLFRTINSTLTLGNVNSSEIDFISAHGTATSFNDEMESIAFNRLGINKIPINSLKGYFGHTLGAAGLIETAICLQSLRNNQLIKSLGYKEEGTSGNINVLTDNVSMEVNTILKTASGFGGCNSSAIIKKLK